MLKLLLAVLYVQIKTHAPHVTGPNSSSMMEKENVNAMLHISCLTTSVSLVMMCKREVLFIVFNVQSKALQNNAPNANPNSPLLINNVSIARKILQAVSNVKLTKIVKNVIL